MVHGLLFVGVDANFTHAVAHRDTLLQLNFCVTEVARRYAAEHARCHLTQLRSLLYRFSEWTPCVDHAHHAAVARRARKIAADLVLQRDDQFGVLIMVERLHQRMFFAIGRLETCARVESQVLDVIFVMIALAAPKSITGLDTLAHEVLQERNWIQLREWNFVSHGCHPIALSVMMIFSIHCPG